MSVYLSTYNFFAVYTKLLTYTVPQLLKLYISTQLLKEETLFRLAAGKSGARLLLPPTRIIAAIYI